MFLNVVLGALLAMIVAQTKQISSYILLITRYGSSGNFYASDINDLLSQFFYHGDSETPIGRL